MTLELQKMGPTKTAVINRGAIITCTSFAVVTKVTNHFSKDLTRLMNITLPKQLN